MVESIVEMFGDDQIGALGSAIGADAGDAKKGLGVALPGMIGALAGKTGNAEGLGGLFEMVQGADSGILDNLGGFLGKSDAATGGTDLLGSLLGNQQDSFIGALAGQSGLGKGMIGKLLPMVAPIVMGWLKKKVAGEGLGAAGLGSFLQSEQAQLATDQPDLFGKLGGILGLGALGAGAAGAVGTAGDLAAGGVDKGRDLAAGTLAKTKKTGFPWWILLAVAGVLLLAWLLTQCGDNGAGTTTTTEAASATTVAAAAPAVTETTVTETTVAETTTTAAAAELAPAAVEIVRNADGTVMLRGTVADQATADALVAKAEELYGAGNVASRLTVGDVAATGGTILLTGDARADEAATNAANAAELAALFGGSVDDQQNVVEGDAGAALTGLLNELVTLEPITFETNSAVITAEGQATLTKALEFFVAYPGVPVLVEGHTDSDGSDAYNLDLSDRRAQSVLEFLVANGVDAERLRSRGFGEADPVADNSTEEGKAANRRIEFSVNR